MVCAIVVSVKSVFVCSFLVCICVLSCDNILRLSDICVLSSCVWLFFVLGLFDFLSVYIGVL